jgi:tetratricopeptide (TPR) repeat protein
MDLGRFDEAWQSIEAEPGDEQYRFGRALQRLGFLLFNAQLGDAESVLADAPELLTEAHALGRVWMTDWVVNLVAKHGVCEGRVHATIQFLDRALEETGSKPTDVCRAELYLAENDAEAALARAQREVIYCQDHSLTIPRVEAVETVLRALVELERWTELIEHARDVIEIADECSFARLQWRLYALRGRAFDELGRGTEAIADRNQARSIFERIAATIPNPTIGQFYRVQAHALGLMV